MARAGRAREITRLPEIWAALQRHAAGDDWVPLDRLYQIVEDHVDLRPADFEPAAPGSRQTRWQRNVRNVLQGRKMPRKTRPAQILWDAPTQSYLIPRRADVLPSADLAAFDIGAATEWPPVLEEDPMADLLERGTTDAREREWRAIMVRRGGRAFRAALLDAYEGRCALSATAGPPALEAAHIVPYRGPETNHVANGLLLRADVHTLFDLGLVAVHPFTLSIDIASELEGTDYRAFAGAPVRLPSDPDAQPSQRSLLFHYKQSKVRA